MRAIHDSQAGLVFRSDVSVSVRVLIASAAHPHDDTDLIDLTPYSGPNIALGERQLNWVRGVQIDSQKEDIVSTATVLLFRETDDGLSLSPFIAGRINGRITKPEDAVIWGGRRIQIWTQLQPLGGQAVPSDGAAVGHWSCTFDGYTSDKIGLGSKTSNVITLECRDRAAPLSDYWITTQIPQTSIPGTPLPADDWYDDLVSDIGAGNLCPLAAYSGHTIGLLNRIIDNTYGIDQSDTDSIAAPFTYPAVTLYNDQLMAEAIPLKPRIAVSQDSNDQPLVQQQSLMAAITDAAIQFGWFIKYRFRPDGGDPTTGSFELQIYCSGKFDTGEENSRSYDGESLPHGQESSGVSFILDPDLYDVSNPEIDLTTIRNRIEVPYKLTSLDGSNNGTGSKDVLPGFSTDSESIKLYGYRSMRATAAAVGMIKNNDTALLAERNMIRDISRPWMAVPVTAPYLPFVELGDCVKLDGPTPWWTEPIWVAVDGFTHAIDPDGKSKTTLKTRRVFVYTEEVEGTFVSAPEGTRPGIDETNVANNWFNGLHAKDWHERAASWGVGPVRNDSFNTLRLVAQASLKDTISPLSTDGAIPLKLENVIVDGVGMVEWVYGGDGIPYTRMTCPVSATYDLSAYASVSGGPGATWKIAFEYSTDGADWVNTFPDYSGNFDSATSPGGQGSVARSVRLTAGTMVRLVIQYQSGEGGDDLVAAVLQMRRSF